MNKRCTSCRELKPLDAFARHKAGKDGRHSSPKHLPRYVDEFSFRLNEGNVKRHTLTRLDSFVSGAAGKRLTYKALIA